MSERITIRPAEIVGAKRGDRVIVQYVGVDYQPNRDKEFQGEVMGVTENDGAPVLIVNRNVGKPKEVTYFLDPEVWDVRLAAPVGPGEAIAATIQQNKVNEVDQITTLQDMLNEAEGQLIVARDSLSRQAAVTNWLCESDPELKAKINAFSAGWTRAKRS